MLACPNAEFIFCVTTVTATGQGIIQALLEEIPVKKVMPLHKVVSLS